MKVHNLKAGFKRGALLGAIMTLPTVMTWAASQGSKNTPEWLRQRTFAQVLQENSALFSGDSCKGVSRGAGWCAGVPTYGNYGGPNWTAGRCVQGTYGKADFDRDSRSAQPIDDADRAFMMHDYEYLKASISSNSTASSEAKKAIDRHLVNNLRRVDLSQSKCILQANYIRLAIQYFSAQL